jgi:hypothetical protein
MIRRQLQCVRKRRTGMIHRQSSATASSKPRKREAPTVGDRNLHHHLAQDRDKKLHGTLLLPGKVVEAGAVAQVVAVQEPAEAAEKEAGRKNENQPSNESIWVSVCARLARNKRVLHSPNASFYVDFIRRRVDAAGGFARRFHI